MYKTGQDLQKGSIFRKQEVQETGSLARKLHFFGKKRLRIALLGYRSNPFSGGQGIYIRYLSQALADLGHQVEVVSGEPYPELSNKVRLVRLPGMNFYAYKTAREAVRERGINSWTDFREWFSYVTGGFPEPYSFGCRVYKYLQENLKSYDLVHDNQSLCYGLLQVQKLGLPVISTIHHPITKDLEHALQYEKKWGMRLLIRRWHSFLKMQKRVTPKLGQIITVSEFSKKDLVKDFKLNPERIQVVHNGIDASLFKPLPEIQRDPWRIMATASADVPLKGLAYLLKALYLLKDSYPKLRLVVLGKPKPKGPSSRLIEELGLGLRVEFISNLSTQKLVQEYARSFLAVVPSLYEGFGLPAAEAMACGVPLVSTTGGALPEVVGESGLLVPQADDKAIAQAIKRLIQNKELWENLRSKGRKRILDKFSWRRAAEKTAESYELALEDKKIWKSLHADH